MSDDLMPSNVRSAKHMSFKMTAGADMGVVKSAPGTEFLPFDGFSRHEEILEND